MASKKLRFRGDATAATNRIDDIVDEGDVLQDVDATEVVDGIHKRSSGSTGKDNSDIKSTKEKKAEEEEGKFSANVCWYVCLSAGCCVHGIDFHKKNKLFVGSLFLFFLPHPEYPSFMDFFKLEMTRGYLLEHDEERYTARRKKIYSFMRIPRDLERFMVYGIMQCADSFLYIHTFLPVRFTLAVWGMLTRPIASCLGLRRRKQRLLTPAEICDLLKGSIWIVVTLLMLSVDTNRVYHIIKSQSIIKLYLFYNMLEVGDRLLSAFGQDTIDALFWTATEPKNSKREHFGLITHILFALIYVVLHSFLIMFQATTLNVAVNSNNKGLLTIMISNNFVELKGSVFKKFDKNNLFQLTCSDVRERFHLSVLLFIVMIQTMKEFDWSITQFCVMLPDCFSVLITEILIDWIKHAFITRFNELPECIYREYTTSLAYDMTQTRQKHAFSDHSDLVARRMGFIPFPLAVVLIKAIYSAVSFNNLAAWILFSLAYLFALGMRIALTICALGKACKLMKEHQDEKCNTSTPSSMTNVPPVGTGTAKPGSASLVGSSVLASSSPILNRHRTDVATSPTHPSSFNFPLQRSITTDLSSTMSSATSTPKQNTTAITTSPTTSKGAILNITHNDIELDVKSSLELGATALFSNSDVDLDDVCLNEHVLDTNTSSTTTGFVEEALARSEPDLQQSSSVNTTPTSSNPTAKVTNTQQIRRRTHKRSESEPSMQSIVGSSDSSESSAAHQA
ncbi:protein TAPT1 homolog [Musca vetustissima]|uniref:protein TAPT1 homolog n=1 Tax=Musca vetustissima TaxID=27455 RepID=UPI002AB76E61|nr:protein TAPT1 homolog [Musca vetustissima]